MAQLPIHRLTLYKQGIGHFEREGDIDSPTVTLVIPRDATNDVLKSLNVWTADSGSVLSIDYETPANKQKRLDALPVKLEDRSGMVDLLTSLRGAGVTLHVDNQPDVEGRIIGVEASIAGETQSPAVLLQQESEVSITPLMQISGITIHDERASANVGYYLDVSSTEQTHTSLIVRLSSDASHLNMSYQAPSPTWRVSYRLIGDGQRAQLWAWGLFDNTLDEDLNDVALTLISGRPISFEYSLYHSHTQSRPYVADDQSAEALANSPLGRESIASLSHELRTPLTSINGYAQLLLQGAADGELTTSQRGFVQSISNSAKHLSEIINNLLDVVRLKDDMSTSEPIVFRTGPLGDLKVSGSYFMPVTMGNAEQEFLTYRVESPISVRRGQSAMVPLFSTSLDYEELIVYNGAKMPNHPLRVWRFENGTGVALEQGPVSVLRTSEYQGDGLIRFAGVGDEVQIPFALEFGILVSMRTETEPPLVSGVVFDPERRLASVEQTTISNGHYLLTSHISTDTTVLIERRNPRNGEFFEMPDPVMDLEGHKRWTVPVAAYSEAAFTVREREFRTGFQDVMTWNPDIVENLRTRNLLAEREAILLDQLMELKQQAADQAEVMKELEAERIQIVSRQEQLRQNLAALGTSERENTIRNRILDDLERSEDRRRAIEASLEDRIQQNRTRSETQIAILDELFGQGSEAEAQ
jgi:hypothetical protein